MARVPTTKAGKERKVARVMGEFGEGKLRSGSKRGPVVTERPQAVAIALKQSGQARKPAKKREVRNRQRSR